MIVKDMRESDWKIFRELRQIALERFCQRILNEIEGLSSDANKSFHERYLDIYRHIQQQDRELGRIFDAPRRSQAVMQLALISSLGLLEPEELIRFSEETRQQVASLTGGTFLRQAPSSSCG